MKRADVLRQLKAVAHLPFVDRVNTPAGRKVVRIYTASVVVMFAGVYIADSKHVLSESTGISHLVWDVIGYCFHGIGTIPLAKHWEPFFTLVKGDRE